MPFLPIEVVVFFIVSFSIGTLLGYLGASRRKVLISKIEVLTETVLNIPIQGFDREGRIFLWNRASEMTYGYLRSEAIGKKFADLILTENEKEEFMKNIENMCATNKPAPSRQLTMLTRGGQKRTMYSTIFPFTRFGRCDGIFCIDVDITDIKNYEQELVFSRENYKALFNGVSHAVLVLEPDTGKIIEANEELCQMFQVVREDLCDMQIGDLVYGEKERIKDEIRTLTAKAFYEGPQSFELLMLTSQRKILSCEVNLKKTSVHGKECILINIRDISKRKTTERRLIESERRYHNLLRNSSALIFTLDKNGVFTSVNKSAEKNFGFAHNFILGKHFTELLPLSQQAKARKIFEQVLEEDTDREEELTMIKGDKKEAEVLVNVWPECRDDIVVGVHGIATDITEQKKGVARMRQMVIDIVAMLSETVSVADRYTEKHCERLQDLSLKIGESLKLSEKQLEYLKFASLLHDVGKVGVPIHILVKKEKLTDEEWEKIREHPKKGADIVRQLSGFEEVAEIIEQHQERYDGKGYPRGLKGDAIKIEARIISAVDAFDAMTSDRPYRKAMSQENAFAELKKHSGTQFSPEVVDAFISILNSESK